MSKLEDAMTKGKVAAMKAERNGYSHATVQLEDLRVLIDWIEETRSKNEYLLGERVKLAVSGDPEDAPEPKTGVIIGFAAGGGMLIRPETGEYSETVTGLWYARGSVEKMED